MTFPPKSALIACEITYLRIQKTSKQQKCENRAESYAIASENNLMCKSVEKGLKRMNVMQMRKGIKKVEKNKRG